MTEIPMPGDYGTQPQPQPQEKGCCTRCCECWMWILLAIILLIATLVILAMMIPGFLFLDIFG